MGAKQTAVGLRVNPKFDPGQSSLYWSTCVQSLEREVFRARSFLIGQLLDENKGQPRIFHQSVILT